MTTQETCSGCSSTEIVTEIIGGKDEGESWPLCADCARSHYRFSCSECGCLATTEVADASGVLWPLCANCDVWWRETEAEREAEAEAMRGMCQDCHVNPVTCYFYHLDKGKFYLCDDCFGMADHEDDYLDYCDHAFPEGEPGQTHCDLCRRQLREPDAYCTCAEPETYRLERINCRSCGGRIRYRTFKIRPLCDCAVVITVDGDKTVCFLCNGHVPPPLPDEEADRLRANRK